MSNMDWDPEEEARRAIEQVGRSWDGDRPPLFPELHTRWDDIIARLDRIEAALTIVLRDDPELPRVVNLLERVVAVLEHPTSSASQQDDEGGASREG